MEMMRLDRFLANSGCGTRSDIKKQIRSGGVTVDGRVETDPGRKIDPGKERVILGGREISLPGKLYYMLNKCAGTVTATRDAHFKTVMDLLPVKQDDLFPVGRLDLDTEGLLLITNDGELAHRLTSPSWHVDKTYLAVVTGTIGASHQAMFEEGLDIGDERKTLPAKLNVIREEERRSELLESLSCVMQEHTVKDTEAAHLKEISFVEVQICEGRYHQVKRMFEAVGEKVLYLRRVQMGPVFLDRNLSRGESRMLCEEEVRLLWEAVRRKN